MDKESEARLIEQRKHRWEQVKCWVEDWPAADMAELRRVHEAMLRALMATDSGRNAVFTAWQFVDRHPSMMPIDDVQSDMVEAMVDASFVTAYEFLCFWDSLEHVTRRGAMNDK